MAESSSKGRLNRAGGAVTNKPATSAQLKHWVSKHRQADGLLLRHVMESTGVYQEAVAWHLYLSDQSVGILLPDKAKRNP